MHTFYRHVFVFLFVLFGLSDAIGQKLFVYDQQTGNPISDVFIYNDKKTVTGITDEVGMVNMKSFGKNDVINLQHSSYSDERINIESLQALKFAIGLNQKLIDLNEIVISANKWEIDKKEIPNKIEVIKSKDIVFENPQTTADMLSSGGQVYVQKSQLAGGSPMLRGFSANKILFIVDGVRMNNAIYRSGNLHNVLQADVNSIETAEVIFGPGTNIYGSDALGGVIDFHTLTPKFSPDDAWKTSGHGLARISSANFEKTVHADINIANKKWAMMASISFSDFEDLKMGKMHNEYATRPQYVTEIDGQDSMVDNSNINLQRYSGYNQLSILAKVKQQYSKNVDWTFSFYYTQTNNVPRYDRLLQYSGDVLKYSEWYYSPQQWFMNSLEMNFRRKTKMYDQASFTFAFQNVQEGRNDRKYQDEWLRKRKEGVNIFSINADFDKTFRKQNYIFYGLEFVFNDVKSTGREENIFTGDSEPVSTRYPDGSNKYIQAGAYMSYKKNYTDKPLSLQAGLRFSYVNLRSTFEDTTFYKYPSSEITLNNGSLTGSGGLTYRPGRWQFRFNLSSGFRAPNLDDVGKLFDSEPGNVVVPNEDLKPEYLYNVDVGIFHNFNNIVTVDLTGFYSYLVDAIVRRDYQVDGQDSIWYDGEYSQVQAMVNTGSAQIYGATLIVNWKILETLGFNTALTFIKGIDDEGYAMRHAPPLYGRSSLTYELNKLKLAVSADYNAEVSNANLAPSEQNKSYLYATDSDGNPYSPAWWTLNFKGSYAFNEKFLVTFGIENILDYRYRPYSSGITAAGRNFIAAFRYSF